jgi:plastocyanin
MSSIYKFLFAAFAIAASCSNAGATEWTVQVQNYTFANNPGTVTVGDTITWVWVEGSHTTTSTSVPAGAASWNSAISANVTTFSYVVTEAGTYNYQCTPHSGFMFASFVAQMPGVMELSIGVTDTLSCIPTDCPATLMAYVINGETPYTYAWSTGDTGYALYNQCAGTYTLTVTDGSGATATATANVNIVCGPPISTAAILIGTEQVVITWEAPVCAPKYRIRVKNMATGIINVVSVNAPANNKLITHHRPHAKHAIPGARAHRM